MYDSEENTYEDEGKELNEKENVRKGVRKRKENIDIE